MSRLRFLLYFCSIYLLRSTAAVGAPSPPGGIRSPRSPTRHHECRAVAQELTGLHLGAGVTIPSDKIHGEILRILLIIMKYCREIEELLPRWPNLILKLMHLPKN